MSNVLSEKKATSDSTSYDGWGGRLGVLSRPPGCVEKPPAPTSKQPALRYVPPVGGDADGW